MKIEKTVTEAINYRRSVRIYNQEEEIDTKAVRKCLRMLYWHQQVVIYNYGNFTILPVKMLKTR